jgi:acrylyl-CoA reductase (NADPH)
VTKIFTALILEEDSGKPRAHFSKIGLNDLPDYDVLVEVHYSSLNYKDALAVSGQKRIARRSPLIGGIDLAGVVVSSRDEAWKPGDRVIVNGWGLSETENGGYTRYQKLKPQWLTRLPQGITFVQAMAIGTAGYTAAMCVEALVRWGTVNARSEAVLVTGAAGGVGSVATALLAGGGFRVAASSGRADARGYLERLGAAEILSRQELADAGAPLQKERWAGAVDSVGGKTLVNVLAQTVYGGAVTACGLAGGSDLPGTVLPYILRGIALLGIDSVMAPGIQREAAWARLVRDLAAEKLEAIMSVEPMSRLPDLANALLAGSIRGRIAIDVCR